MLTKEKVIEIINKNDLSLDPQNTSEEESFKSLGVDSLDFFNVLVEIEEITGQKVPDEDVDKLNNIKELLDYFS